MRVRVAQNAPHSGARVLENIQGLPQVMLSDTSFKLERRRSDDRLSVQRTQRGASWASGAAQAAQFVRIILEASGRLRVRAAWRAR